MLMLLWYYSLHKLGRHSIEQIHHNVYFCLFQGFPIDRIRHLVDSFLDLAFEEMFNPPVVQKLREAQQNGHMTAILSSSPDFLVRAIAERFAVDTWQATEYTTDERGAMNGVAHVVLGSDKATRVLTLANKYSIPLQNIIGYSDSHHDLPFLQTVGMAVAVKPDNVLKQISQEHHWEVMQ